MLILSNEDVEQVLGIGDCISVLEDTYRDAAAGNAVNGHRSDILVPTPTEDAAYDLKMMGAVVPRLEIGAIRLNSDILKFPIHNGRRRKVKIPAAPGGRWVGLVLLFSTRTGEPLAIFPDGVVQRFRVGATSGLGVKYLARADATTVALIGTGWQAGAQAMAVAAVRPIKEIRCFSPNPENRRRFCAEFEQSLGISVVPAESAEQAARSADIVLCATNSLSVVAPDKSIEPGMHLGSIRDGEVDRATLVRADRLVVHDPNNFVGDHVVVANGAKHADEIREVPADIDLPKFANAPSLAELIAGRVAGRGAPADITCFLNYQGIGLQFAAVGAALYRKALETKCGRELPTDWFTESVHA